MNKEDKSKEYSELKVRQYDKNNTIEKYGMYRAMQQCNFDGFDLRDAFEAGRDDALKSQWVKVDERMPKVEEYVIVMIEYEGNIQIHSTMYVGEVNWTFADVKIIAWMPIPSFDDILEANKGVLERLKDK